MCIRDRYREVAPNDNTQYILKYKILKEKKAPLAEQIKVLAVSYTHLPYGGYGGYLLKYI